MLSLKHRKAQNGMSVTGEAFKALSETRSDSDRERWTEAEGDALKLKNYSIYGMAEDKGKFWLLLKS
jgi:hypothetical protein